jgi:DNA-binding transcriptional ArsR family regulator
MLRIRFQHADFGRVRFMISPMAETVLSVSALQQHGDRLPFARWRDAQRPKLASAPSRVLLALVPADWRPRVALAPIVGERPRFDEELDAILDFDPHPLRAYLATLDSPALTARWMPMIANGVVGERRFLGCLLSDYHHRCVAEHWPAIRVQLEADIVYRNGLRAEHGVARVLATLHPAIRWNDAILELGIPGPSHHMELGGRGLVLVPSAFLWPHPAILLDGNGQPVLLYPARDAFALWNAPPYDRETLAALLGATRAAVLVAATHGATTSQLAKRLEVSIPSVSQHLTALRHAGLVRSTRCGRAVHHDLTGLGIQVLLGSGRFSDT